MNCFTVSRKKARFCLLLSAGTICKMTITGLGQDRWTGFMQIVSWPLKKYINKSVVHLLEQSFWIMYSNLDLSFRWALPLFCELFYCWPEIANIFYITVRGHKLQKVYSICRQKLMAWDRTAEGVLCMQIVSWPFKKVKHLFSADHLLDKSFRMMYSNLGLSFRWTLPVKLFSMTMPIWVSTNAKFYTYSKSENEI